ncbi:MAG: hypothetical protein IT303_07240 [Dehalococcoidia bacterium]|nr:hypothetical protein [Dehalococcoidia bacterium]
MSTVLELLTLQGLDDEAAALRAALSDVERRIAGDEELMNARRAFAEADDRVNEVRRRQRRLEDEIETLSDKIAREEKRLYDGSVKNPKELSSLQHEVESLKAHRSPFEDELIGVLDEFEREERARKEAARTMAQLEALREAHLVDLRREGRRLNDAILKSDTRREIQKAKIPPRPLAAYEDLRRRKGGMAIAKISAGSCLGCRVSVPDAIRRRALSSNELAQCPNCERILSLG